MYYVSGLFNTPSQILVTSELDPKMHASLRVLTKRAQKADVENFLRMEQASQSREIGRMRMLYYSSVYLPIAVFMKTLKGGILLCVKR